MVTAPIAFASRDSDCEIDLWQLVLFPSSFSGEEHVSHQHDCSQLRQERRGRNDGRVRTDARAHCGGLYCSRRDHWIAGESRVHEHRHQFDGSDLRMLEANAMVRVAITLASGRLARVRS
jgi:hypothetical protein